MWIQSFILTSHMVSTFADYESVSRTRTSYKLQKRNPQHWQSRQTEDLADVSLSVRKGSSTAKYDIFPVLFNILRFSNEVCDAGDGTEGVCYTGEECTEKVNFFYFLFVCERRFLTINIHCPQGRN